MTKGQNLIGDLVGFTFWEAFTGWSASLSWGTWPVPGQLDSELAEGDHSVSRTKPFFNEFNQRRPNQAESVLCHFLCSIPASRAVSTIAFSISDLQTVLLAFLSSPLLNQTSEVKDNLLRTPEVSSCSISVADEVSRPVSK